MKKDLLHTIFAGVGMALGVATLVMSLLGGLSSQTAFSLLGLGVAALGIAQLEK